MSALPPEGRTARVTAPNDVPRGDDGRPWPDDSWWVVPCSAFPIGREAWEAEHGPYVPPVAPEDPTPTLEDVL